MRAKGTLRVLCDVVENTFEPRMIFRMQIDGENPGQQNAVGHLESGQLHVTDQFADNGPAV